MRKGQARKARAACGVRQANLLAWEPVHMLPLQFAPSEKYRYMTPVGTWTMAHVLPLLEGYVADGGADSRRSSRTRRSFA